MTVEVKVPILPESVADAIIATWHKKPGDAVKREENLVDLETDKVVLEVPSPVDGVLVSIVKQTGDSVTSQELIATIQEGAAVAAAPAAAAVPAAGIGNRESGIDQAPSVRRIAAETGIDPATVAGTGRGDRVTKEDMLKAQSAPAPAAAPAAPSKAVATTAAASTAISVPAGARTEQRVPMTRLRARIAERMMQSKNSIAMLTSFNEINMKPVMDIRKKYAETFEKVHGIKLGFMSFFVKACTEALKLHPIVNASVDGNDVIYHAYQDIGVAVATEKGLVCRSCATPTP